MAIELSKERHEDRAAKGLPEWSVEAEEGILCEHVDLRVVSFGEEDYHCRKWVRRNEEIAELRKKITELEESDEEWVNLGGCDWIMRLVSVKAMPMDHMAISSFSKMGWFAKRYGVRGLVEALIKPHAMSDGGPHRPHLPPGVDPVEYLQLMQDIRREQLGLAAGEWLPPKFIQDSIKHARLEAGGTVPELGEGPIAANDQLPPPEEDI